MRNKGLKKEQALARAHRGLSSTGQPIQPYFPSPSSPLLCPAQIPSCMLDPGSRRTGVSGTVCVCVCWGLGWAGNIPPYLGPPFTGCCGPQRINGAEATHFLCDRPHHTAPHCWQPLSREVPLPPSGGGCWAPPPTLPASHLTFLCFLEAGKLGRTGIMKV